MSLTLISQQRCFDGEQRYYEHASSATGTTMTFSIYLPDAALNGQSCAALMYLSGLTCTPDNVTHKGHAQQTCSELEMIFIAPDTSPRGDAVANTDEEEVFYVGQGASYYVNATQSPWQTHYQMHDYICKELYQLIQDQFNPASMGIMGHSMGGHGALTLGFLHPDLFVSVSAIAPVSAASESQWGQAAFTAYFGEDTSKWPLQTDATQVIEKHGRKYDAILVDQGGADEFYQAGNLKPEKLLKACQAVDQPIDLRIHAHFDHSYYFIQTVMPEHILFHYKAAALQ